MLFSRPLKSFALSANDYDLPFCEFDNHDESGDGDVDDEDNNNIGLFGKTSGEQQYINC